MSKPTFRIPGPIGGHHGRGRSAGPEHRHVGVATGSVFGNHDEDPVSTTGPTGRTPSPKPAFPHIRRDEFYASARARMEDPGKIRQRKSSLCGPAALMFLVARNWPALYYQFVVDLYELGKARLNRLRVAPGEACRHFDPHGKIDPADWVALAGLRDSENSVFDYSDTSDRAAGATIPSTLVDWLERAGFKGLYNETNIYLTKGEKNLRDAAQRWRDGAQVCLFINSAVLKEAPSDRDPISQAFTGPNHWVVLTSDIAIDGDGNLSFTVFTWGNAARPVAGSQNGPTKPGAKLTLNQWLQNYYGYVACKP
jgi:hypothetical protein